MMHVLALTSADAQAWAVVIAAVAAAITGVISALYSRHATAQMRPPSNNVSLGALVEGIAQVQHMLVHEAHPDANIPPATAVARSLQAAPGADGMRVDDATHLAGGTPNAGA